MGKQGFEGTQGKPRERLRELALDPHAGVRREVARHPATPPHALARLALDDNFWVRTEAAAHPAFPEALRERLRRAGASGDLSAFGEPDPSLAPEVLAELAAAGPWGERLAARHPATPLEVLRRLAEHESVPVRADVARHPRSPAELLARLIEDGDKGVRRAAAGHPRAPEEGLARLRRAGAGEALDGEGTVDSGLPIEALVRLARGGPFARRLAARHPSSPAGELARLASDLDAEIRLAVAQNPACPGDVLLAFAGDGDPRVRQVVAAHPASPGEALIRLAEEESDDVELLAAIAAHPASPPQLLARLAEHGAFRVRERVAAHPTYPDEHRRLLVRAGSTADLLAFAAPDPALSPVDLVRLAQGGTWARRLAAHHPGTPAADLARLAADSDLLVREAAAGNPATPREILELLARAGSSWEAHGFTEPTLRPTGAAGGRAKPESPRLVSAEDLARLAALGPWGRRLAARRPEAPAELLAVLSQDPDPEVRASVAAHPGAGAPTLLGLAQDVAAGVRWAVVRRPDVPRDALSLLARDPLSAIRAAVAGHPATPPAVRESLARDLDEDVRGAASAGSPAAETFADGT